MRSARSVGNRPAPIPGRTLQRTARLEVIGAGRADRPAPTSRPAVTAAKCDRRGPLKIRADLTTSPPSRKTGHDYANSWPRWIAVKSTLLFDVSFLIRVPGAASTVIVPM